MKIFKFGGASVSSASAVKNVAQILDGYRNEKIIVVVSAMGKTTNGLEKVLALCDEKNGWKEAVKGIAAFHNNIIENLFESSEYITIKQKTDALFQELESILHNAAGVPTDELYDRIVPYGELISTRIVEAYLSSKEYSTVWLDARSMIRTDSRFRNGRVDWDATCELVKETMSRKAQDKIAVTQGFIASDTEYRPITLGREGSDYTAAILASCLNAESVTIWKDVPGILNADPKLVADTTLFPELPYMEAAEMTYYGASVIHPKTIRPLAAAKIPLYVRSFVKPEDAGTVIHDCQIDNLPPVIIYKFNQVLLSFSMPAYQFINEKHLMIIFHAMDKFDIRINVMQNSAVSFSVCADYREEKLKGLLEHLENDFDIRYNDKNVRLITVKNYDEFTVSGILSGFAEGHKVLLEQRTRSNYQVVVEG